MSVPRRFALYAGVTLINVLKACTMEWADFAAPPPPTAQASSAGSP